MRNLMRNASKILVGKPQGERPLVFFLTKHHAMKEYWGMEV
jgi:hypothetical protein